MSRFRNRNIRKKITDSTLLKTDKKNNNTVTADSGIDVISNREFGNELSAYNPYSRNLWSRISSISSETEDDFKSEIKGMSSSSSLSWADDYEDKASDLVGKEYERMERVLQRLEPIPSHYDKDEYKLWIKTFPCLSLTGQSTITASKKVPESMRKLNERRVCDKTTTSEDKYRAEDSNMDKYLGELCPKTPSPTTNLGTNNTLNPNTLSIQFKTFLQISPVTLPQNSSRTKSSAYSRTSHWLHNIKDMKPLPPLFSTPARKKSTFAPNCEKDEEFIILPPIGGNLSPFRSISAVSGRRSVFHNKVIDYGHVIEENSDEVPFDSNKKSGKLLERNRNRFLK